MVHETSRRKANPEVDGVVADANAWEGIFCILANKYGQKRYVNRPADAEYSALLNHAKTYPQLAPFDLSHKVVRVPFGIIPPRIEGYRCTNCTRIRKDSVSDYLYEKVEAE